MSFPYGPLVGPFLKDYFQEIRASAEEKAQHPQASAGFREREEQDQLVTSLAQQAAGLKLSPGQDSLTFYTFKREDIPKHFLPVESEAVPVPTVVDEAAPTVVDEEVSAQVGKAKTGSLFDPGLEDDSVNIDKRNSELVRLVKLVEEEIDALTTERQREFWSCKKENALPYSFNTPSTNCSLFDYIKRFIKYKGATRSELIMALIYLGRLDENPGVFITKLNIHRLFAAAFVVAVKVNDDDYYGNKYLSRIAGVEVSNFNKNESAFMEALDYNLGVSSEEYKEFNSSLIKKVRENRLKELSKSTFQS